MRGSMYEKSYQLIESEDIREHLKNIRYEFSNRDIAYLIWVCDSLSVKERYRLWNRLIDASDDLELSEYMNKLIKLEERILTRLLAPGEPGYSYTVYLDSGDCIAGTNQCETIEECLRQSINEKGIVQTEIRRRISEDITVYALILPDGKISRIGDEGLSPADERLWRAINRFGFKFPCQFIEGEYLKRINGIGIFATQPLRFVGCSYSQNSGMLAECEYIDGFGDKCISGIPIFDLERC